MRNEEKDIKLILNTLNHLVLVKPNLFTRQQAEEIQKRCIELN